MIPKAKLVFPCLFFPPAYAEVCFPMPYPPEAEGGEVQLCQSREQRRVMSPETFISLIHASNKIALHFS